LKDGRNFSYAFVIGVRGAGLKKDGIVKHSTSMQHLRAEKLQKGRLPMDEFFKQTAIGKWASVGVMGVTILSLY